MQIKCIDRHMYMQGSKLARVDVVYTPWANLRKTASMAVGQACAARAAVKCSATALLSTLATRLINQHVMDSLLMQSRWCHRMQPREGIGLVLLAEFPHMRTAGRVQGPESGQEGRGVEEQRDREQAQPDEAGRVPQPGGTKRSS